MATRRRSVSRGTVRRKRIWARRIIANTVIAAGTVQHSMLLADFETAYGAQLIGCTVARIRMDLGIDTTGTNSLIYGIRVATIDQVSDLAVAPTYGPGTRPHADWMAWGRLTSDGALVTREVDVRSQRKIDELAQTLVLSVENGGAAALDWNAVVSVLVLLP